MRIAGLQKLTLLDYPGRLACTVFTAGCNMRCPFCQNSSLVLPGKYPKGISTEEFLEFLKKRRGRLDGVAVTGGEPLVHTDIDEFLREVKSLGYLVKLDTNGTFPERLEALVNAGLVDRVAMDVKNSPEEYARTAGTAVDMEAVARTKDYLLGNHVEYEFRTTVVGGLHTVESITALAKWISGAREYYLQQYVSSDTVLAPGGLYAPSKETMLAMRDAAKEYVPGAALRGI